MNVRVSTYICSMGLAPASAYPMEVLSSPSIVNHVNVLNVEIFKWPLREWSAILPFRRPCIIVEKGTYVTACVYRNGERPPCLLRHNA